MDGWIVAAVLGLLFVTRTAGAAPPCIGDCGRDGLISVNELVQGVNIALGNAERDLCAAFDGNADLKVTVDELVSGVNNALNGCPTFAGSYYSVVPLTGGQTATLNLTAQSNGQLTGTVVVNDGATARFEFGGSAAVVGSGSLTGTFDLDTGTFSVTGSYLNGEGQNVPVDVSGTFPDHVGGAGSVSVHLGGDSFPGSITTGNGSTPTPTRTQPPASTPTPPGTTPTSTPTPTATPTVGSSGGQRLVCAGNDAGLFTDILLLNTDGSGRTNLTNTPNSFDRDPEWSPNGSRIVWSASTLDQGGALRYHIFVMNADGSGRTDVTPDESDAGEPSWSPDGSRIIFIDNVGNDRIKVINADGTGLATILPNPAGARINSPHWNGNRIVFASTLHIAHDSQPEDLEIYLMNADGTGITRVTNNTFRDEFPVWRPDGQRIAFQSYRPAGPQIWFINPNGSGETKPDTGFLPSNLAAFSHDGKQLAYYGALPFQGFFGGIIIANADASSGVGVPGTNGFTGFDLK